MNFSIIVITYNCEYLTRMAIRSLVQQSYPKEFYEVIVIDDGSETCFLINEDLISLISYSFYYLPRTSESCRARARNFGASKAIYDNLIFIDGDQYVNPNLILNYYQFLKINPETPVVLGTRIDLNEWQSSLLMNSVNDSQQAKLHKTISRLFDVREQVRLMIDSDPQESSILWVFFWSHNFFISKSLFFKVGGFDEGFKGWGCEDVELGYRLAQCEAKLKLIDNRVYNLHLKFDNNNFKYGEFLKNSLLFLKKHNSIDVMLYFSFYENTFFGSCVESNKVVNNFIVFKEKIKLYGSSFRSK